MSGESRYTGWYVKSNVSYSDYLQNKEFEKSIRYGIDEQTQQLIASNEQLARENYNALEHINDGINSGFSMLSLDISRLQESIDSGFEQIATIFEWGFSEMLVSLGRVGDSLNALIKIAKTPAQTWAYEQFEIARDEFRRGLYSESLESVQRAINGFGSNPGYKTEFRFHFLQGTIRLGSFKNSDPKVVDPADAEAAFLKAARYASNDLPAEAARSLLCAGRAAFTQRKVDEALKYSTDAIALDGSLIEAYFQSGQAYCALGRPKDAIEHVVTSIVHDHNYSIKAASDGNICQYPEMLKKALTEAKDKLKIIYEQDKNTFKITLNKIKGTVLDGYAVNCLCSEQLTDAYNYENSFDAEASKENIFGYVYAARLAREGKHIIQSVISSFKKTSSKLIDEEQQKYNNAISAIDSEINEIKSTITNIDRQLSISKPGDYKTVDVVMGAVLLIALLAITIPQHIYTVIAAIIILGILTGGFVAMLVLAPPAILICFIRKMIWKSEESSAESRKEQLRQTVGKKANTKKQQFQQKITELQAVKSRISSFNI